jgi:hypothetical protein
LAVAPAGRSAASYTITRDTTDNDPLEGLQLRIIDRSAGT